MIQQASAAVEPSMLDSDDDDIGHIVYEEIDPDTALCGADVTNEPWIDRESVDCPFCEAIDAVYGEDSE